jgi:hypothetical protein
MPKLITGQIKEPMTIEEVKPRPLKPPRRRRAEHEFDRGEPPPIPLGEGPSVEQSPATDNVPTTGPEPHQSITFESYSPMVDPSLPGIFNLAPPDPSGADSPNGVILYVGNTYLVASTDGGASFTDHDPTGFLPAANGHPVDQVMIHVPHRDLYCWMLQHDPSASSGEGHFRLAVTHSSDIAGNVEQGWTTYNFTSSDLGFPGVATDRQDLAYSETRLYMTTNLVGQGRVVMSLSLDDLDQRQPVSWSHTDPLDRRYAFSHLSQQNPQNVHLAAIETSTSLEVMTFDDGAGSYGFQSVAVGQFPTDADLKSEDPDGVDWLTRGVAHVSAALADEGSIWVAWDAAASAPGESPVYPNAHVRIARISTNSWTTLDERQVWNPDYAFAYGCLALADGEVGYGVGVGGSSDYPNSCFGILGDFVVYYHDTSTSTAGASSEARWGDYITVRPSTVDPRRFAAFGYYTDGVGNAYQQRPFHLSYGRP